MLKIGGRCAVIIPDGVLFGSSNAHKKLREQIVAQHKLEAVISMPSGVFKPYAGVSTAVLVFTKTNNGGTDKVWFYDMQADGYSLDDKRSPIKQDNIPDIIQRVVKRDEGEEAKRSRTEQSFLVPFEEIKANDWDLSINRYKEIVYQAVEYAPPAEIITEIEKLDAERMQALQMLKELLCIPTQERGNEGQNQFAKHITSIEKQKQQAQASLTQSNHLFNSLLQKAFTGELSR